METQSFKSKVDWWIGALLIGVKTRRDDKGMQGLVVVGIEETED